MTDRLTDALFKMVNNELQTKLADAYAALAPFRPDQLEAMAKNYNDALASPAAEDIPKEASAKGRALVDLLFTAAEFQRAGTAYAKALIEHMLSDAGAKP